MELLNSLEAENDILIHLREGNEHAFEKIYKLYSPRLLGKLVKLVKSEHHAREILQDVFLKLWKHRTFIDPDKSFSSFLFKIAENKAYDFLRKAARDKNIGWQVIADSTANYIFIEQFKSDDENLALLQKAIESLPPQRQQVFRLCKLEGNSYKKVSELLGISVSTISDHIVKGTKSIRDYFEKNNNSLSGIIIFFLLLHGKSNFLQFP